MNNTFKILGFFFLSTALFFIQNPSQDFGNIGSVVSAILAIVFLIGGFKYPGALKKISIFLLLVFLGACIPVFLFPVVEILTGFQVYSQLVSNNWKLISAILGALFSPSFWYLFRRINPDWKRLAGGILIWTILSCTCLSQKG